MTPPKETLLAQIAGNPNVPSPPPIALRILEKASHPDCTLGEVGRLIGSDASLCGKLLQVVNSALFTRPRAITTVDYAMSLLGLKRVRSLVLSLSLPAMSRRCRADQRLRNFWRTSVATAIIARELAVVLRRPDPESELVAGLLCDLGVLVLREVYGRTYDELLDRAGDQLARRQCALEEETFGASHAEVSAFLLRRWHLPDEITEAIRYHHAPTAAERLAKPLPERSRLLYFANRAAALQFVTDDFTLVREVSDEARVLFGLGEAQLRDFLEPLGKKVDDMGKLMNVDVGASLEYGKVLDTATEQLTRMVYETTLENARLDAEKNQAEEGRQQAEEALRRSEEQLRQAQKMEAVGRLAGGIAHDFNNLLTVINGYSEMLLAMLPQETPLRGPLEQIRKSGERAAALTGQLLAFSRKQIFNPVALDLNRVIANLHKMIRRLVGEDIELVNDLAPSLHPVKADPGQVEQVLLNLIVNARDAMPDGGKITITTANVALKPGPVQALAGAPPGDYALLTVRDTGSGMTPEVRSRIFEPFFTTKEEGKGTGLGLSMVYGIVKQSAGMIEVESEVGRGTVFKIHLPHAGATTLYETQRLAQPPLPRGSETVLLVEDEAPLRELVRLTLQRAGYNVLAAEHGPDALSASGGHAGPIHLLLTDVIMPQMSGPELAQRVTAARADTRVLFMSGYTDDAIIRHGVLHEGVSFLQKPFSSHALASKVREVLTAPPIRC